MIEGKTKNGFEFAIEESVADDWETLELIRKVEDDAAYVIDVAKAILGEEQLDKLKAYIRTEDGKVKATLMMEEISEILNAASTEKNS